MTEERRGADPGPARGRLGPYALLAPLGAGAHGTVHRARHVELGVERAVKVVRSRPHAPDRFQREVRALARVRHPNVVRVHEASDGLPDGPAWLAMDLVEGRSLDEALSRGPLPLDRALDVVEQVARGVAALHAAGVLHRDLKPANVVLAPDGRAVVVDLGLAVGEDDERLTRTGVVVGTPLYLAPELLGGAQGTPATDVHALGLLLHECATGRPAFLGDGAGGGLEVLTRVMAARRPRPSDVDPGLPAGLDALCLEALALDPAQRLPSALAFAERAASLRRAGETPGPSRRGWGVALLACAALAVLAALIVLAALVVGRRGPAPAAPAEPGPSASRAPGHAPGAPLPAPDPIGELLARADRGARAGRRPLARLDHPPGTGTVRARFLADGRVVTLAEHDGHLRVWTLGGGTPAAAPSGGGPAVDLQVHDEHVLVLAGGKLLRTRLPGQQAEAAAAPIEGVRDLARAPDGQALLLLARPGGGAEVQRLDAAAWTRSRVQALAPDPGRPPVRLLGAWGEHVVIGTDASSGRSKEAPHLVVLSPQAREPREHLLPSRPSAFGGDPRRPERLAVGLQGGEVLLLSDPAPSVVPLAVRAEAYLRPAARAERDPLSDAAHSLPVRGAAFTPDGRLLVTVACRLTDRSGGELCWWDVAARRPVGDVLAAEGPVGVDVSPDGRLVAVGTRDGAVELWAVPP